MFKRLWIQIPAPDTGRTFFTLFCFKNCVICLNRPKINYREAGDCPVKKTVLFS